MQINSNSEAKFFMPEVHFIIHTAEYESQLEKLVSFR